MISHHIQGTASSDRKALLGALARADAESDTLALDLTRLDAGNASKRRLAGWWISVVSDLLLGRYGDLSIRVFLPSAPGIQSQLMRGGFYFSLAQRSGKTEHLSSNPRIKEMLDSNFSDWSPIYGPVLLQTADAERLEDHTYLYTNTHVRAESGYFRRYEASAAFPWLGEVVPKSNLADGNVLRNGFLTAVCDTFAEVADNISTHAFNLRNVSYSAGWLGPRIIDRARSCLLVSLTTGGGQHSYDRLHFLAIDNGFSIPRTLRWQHPEPLRFDSAETLMERVLQRRLTDREITDHNGAGLWFLFGLARFAGGELTVICEDDLSDGRNAARVSAVIPAAESDGSSRWASDSLSIPVRGTIIHLQMRIPKILDGDITNIQTKIEDFRRYRSAWPEMASL